MPKNKQPKNAPSISIGGNVTTQHGNSNIGNVADDNANFGYIASSDKEIDNSKNFQVIDDLQKELKKVQSNLLFKEKELQELQKSSQKDITPLLTAKEKVWQNKFQTKEKEIITLRDKISELEQKLSNLQVQAQVEQSL